MEIRDGFEKLNKEPIVIECVEDEHEEALDFEPSFWWWNRRYYLKDFIRLRNNPWISSYLEWPDYIHGMEADQYISPLFIELIDDEFVNIYTERRK